MINSQILGDMLELSLVYEIGGCILFGRIDITQKRCIPNELRRNKSKDDALQGAKKKNRRVVQRCSLFNTVEHQVATTYCKRPPLRSYHFSKIRPFTLDPRLVTLDPRPFRPVAVLIQLKIILIYSFVLIFPDQTIMAQSGNRAARKSNVTSLGTGQGLNFDEDTLKCKDSYNC